MTSWVDYCCDDGEVNDSTILNHTTEDGIVTTDAGSALLVIFFRVTYVVKFGTAREKSTTVPDGAALLVMWYYTYVYRSWL